MYDYLTDEMCEFIKKQNMLFISTSDSNGECDCSFRSANRGFVIVLDKKTLAYPEFKGNGVMASMGNIFENNHIGMLFIDFIETQTGLHINGKAKIVDYKNLKNEVDENYVKMLNESAKKLEQREFSWIFIDVEEAYIHCKKNIPTMNIPS
jgi:predicted pyridoxine 5'-phosphate oxidase superfamily flavin-nucleotide-binding protein